MCSALAQGTAPSKGNSYSIFTRQEIQLDGRLRHLTLERLGPSPAKSIVAVERSGSYPEWKVSLTLWSAEASTGKIKKDGAVSLPPDAVFYGFARPTGAERSSLILVRKESVEAWKPTGGAFETDPRFQDRAASFFSTSPKGEVIPYEPAIEGLKNEGSLIAAPTAGGLSVYSLGGDGLKKIATYPAPLHGFYQSGLDSLPFDLSFWVRGSIWYPKNVLGRFSHAEADDLLWPWMDEVTAAPFEKEGKGGESRTIQFHQLSEEERDDGKSYVVITPVDLNHDGRTDFLVNKFRGTATSLRGETTMFFTRADGTVPENGEQLKAKGNRASGALPVDLNKDGLADLVVASTQYNAWAVVRALIRRLAVVDFSFYIQHPDGFHLAEPDLSHEISFQFDLDEGEVSGLLPTLDGDFNGDGYPDAVFAKNRSAVTVLLQKPGQRDFFPLSGVRSFEVPVPRLMHVGDVDGDGLSDVVLFDTRAAGNRKVTVLMNNGILK
ncbi:MAG: VCBS repeat-containing protein [Pseudomonadota bacterium]